MTVDAEENAREPTREEVDRMQGQVLLEFGTDWCGYCQALAPHLQPLLRRYPEVRHIKIQDGKGKPLGRSYRVKLWPTLVFLRDGRVVRQMSRPDIQEVAEAFKALDAGSSDASLQGS